MYVRQQPPSLAEMRHVAAAPSAIRPHAGPTGHVLSIGWDVWRGNAPGLVHARRRCPQPGLSERSNDSSTWWGCPWPYRDGHGTKDPPPGQKANSEVEGSNWWKCPIASRHYAPWGLGKDDPAISSYCFPVPGNAHCGPVLACRSHMMRQWLRSRAGKSHPSRLCHRPRGND
jgi:hypothetical protein